MCVFVTESAKGVFGVIVWQAVTAKSLSSFKSWSSQLLALASCKIYMVSFEDVSVNSIQ